MNSRVSYLQSLNEFTSPPPIVTVTNNSSVLPHSTVNIVANIQEFRIMFI